jgi:hypothetical protein
LKDIEKRLRKLEAKATPQGSHLLDLLYQVLTGGFGPKYDAEAGRVFESLGREAANYLPKLKDDHERGIGNVLLTGTDGPFDIERFRGIVPDRVLSAAYNTMRNYAHADPSVVLRVRKLAGVVDEGGAPLPGFVLHSNGCILDAA